MNNRKNAYTEVYTILKHLNEEEYKKIPPEIIEALNEKIIRMQNEERRKMELRKKQQYSKLYK